MKKRIKSSYCTNCGKVLQPEDNFCPHCGQENDNKRQSFGGVMSDLIQGFLSIDSRLRDSIPALLFRPAFLTKEYLRGKRQSYLDPVRMFIAIVVIYFLIASIGHDNEKDNNGNIKKDSTSLSINSETDSIQIIQEGPLKFSVFENDLSVVVADSLSELNDELEIDEKHYSQIRAMVKSGITDTRKIMDSLNIENTFWNRFYYGEVVKFAKTDFNDLKDYFVSKLPWIIFFMMPVFAFILKIVYIRKRYLFVDHLIFAFHLHAFYFMIGILYVITSTITGYEPDALANGSTIIYTLFALKNFYGQGWIKTLLKSIVLFLLYAITAMFCLIFIALFIFLIY